MLNNAHVITRMSSNLWLYHTQQVSHVISNDIATYRLKISGRISKFMSGIFGLRVTVIDYIGVTTKRRDVMWSTSWTMIALMSVDKHPVVKLPRETDKNMGKAKTYLVHGWCPMNSLLGPQRSAANAATFSLKTIAPTMNIVMSSFLKSHLGIFHI